MPKQDLLAALRCGDTLSLRQQLTLTLQLSVPAILAQISSIVMQYIDASMVGHLGREASASIGLVASSTWLMNGLCRALVVGFSVMVAQRIGAGEERDARNLVKQALFSGVAFGLLLAAVGVALSGGLPHWLHADSAICPDASAYFLIFSLSLPFVQLNRLTAGLLQAGGNMRTPSVLLVLMCGLDVVFNLLLIFPSRQLGGFTLPGAGLGVAGAALGTALSETVVALIMCACLLRSSLLGLWRGERLRFVPAQLRRAVRLGVPVAIEQAVMSSAQVVALGTEILRIVVFAEPLFGAAIVTAGVFQGAGSSLLSSVLNFTSMWGVRITLTLLMVPHWGLQGAWIAMCIELCFRGLLFLFFLWRKKWLPREWKDIA